MVLSAFEIFSCVAIIVLPNFVSPSCYEDRSYFGTYIKSKGYPRCTEQYDLMYVRGFQRSKGSNDDLRDVEMVKCCQPPQIHQGKPFLIQSADWEMSFNKEGWAHCLPGFFLHGFYRGDSHQLKSIRWATCAKPAFHPYWYKECYDEALGDGNRWECSRRNYYVVGIHRGAAETLSSINKFKCCSMYDELIPLKSLEDVKTQIMDVTLNYLGLLANLMGYGWCGGCRTEWSGEDFRREGDSWKSNYQEPCEGYLKTDRLEIVYENFAFKVKNMEYLTPETKDLTPIVSDVGQVKNTDALPATTKVAREIKAVRTVTHTSETRFKSAFGASVTLSYTSPPLGGAIAGTFSGSITLSGGNEGADINKDEEGTIQWDIFRVREPHPIGGNSGVAYKIVTSRNKVDVPYRATIKVQFTARLEGFLRAGADFHQTHQGSHDRPHVSFTIGSSTSPFYEFLELVSRRGDRPWLWHDLKQRYTSAQTYIDKLTDESIYEFVLEGTFHDISGLNSNVEWSDIDVSNANATVNA